MKKESKWDKIETRDKLKKHINCRAIAAQSSNDLQSIEPSNGINNLSPPRRTTSVPSYYNSVYRPFYSSKDRSSHLYLPENQQTPLLYKVGLHSYKLRKWLIVGKCVQLPSFKSGRWVDSSENHSNSESFTRGYEELANFVALEKYFIRRPSEFEGSHSGPDQAVDHRQAQQNHLSSRMSPSSCIDVHCSVAGVLSVQHSVLVLFHSFESVGFRQSIRTSTRCQCTMIHPSNHPIIQSILHLSPFIYSSFK